MSLVEQHYETEDLHPIDIVESLAEHHDWDFDRIADDQIAMAVEGQWRTYSVTLAWSHYDETLRLVMTFDMEPPAHRVPALHAVLNAANDKCWTGAFTHWAQQNLLVYRYALVLSGGALAGPEQIDRMLTTAFLNCERFYPAFQLATWGEEAPEAAIQVAIAEAYGRA
ncbi:YbjN domain-containing protein [Dinoroseobacter sp. PD6]|nr:MULTISPECIES: YbjN domain-containing protein [Dinoroseobacter]MDD9717657.1 YbjN domain-containing protein [Dinoroseobacter sp. PD6]URF48581.1 YbjN domain-containing protein [Dinoroseobacter shibae]URF52893.1 YbjN domain-containing protein [Dinoroseobacter shibae]